jgi:hypothetical protein
MPCLSQQRWERNYGGAGDDRCYSVEQTWDRGYIIVGYSRSYGNADQVYLVKINATGDTLWTRTYGGEAGEAGYTIQQTTDRGYIVAGWTGSYGNSGQVYLVKTNASGRTLWARTYGGASDDGGYSVQQTTDRGYIIAGYTYSFGNGIQVYLVKTNASGDTLWTRTYGGAGDDYGRSVKQTSDGGYIVAGEYDYGGTNPQVYLVKTNASGNTLWTKTYGGTGDNHGYHVQQTIDGGYILAGWTNSYGNGGQVYLVKTNATGDTLWTRTYGGASFDWSFSVQQTLDWGYIIAGGTDSYGNGGQVYLVKTNATGDTLWTRTYGGVSFDYGYSVQTSDGGYIVAGYTTSFGNSLQVYIIKTDGHGSSGMETTEERGQRLEIGVKTTPNPFSNFAVVPGREKEIFVLYDITGRKLGTYRGDRIGEGLAAGVYFVCEGTACRAPTRIVKVR